MAGMMAVLLVIVASWLNPREGMLDQPAAY
jgi:hypothetical protein